MPVTHTKISGKSDGPDATLVRPSDWNADHVITGLGAPQGRLTLAASLPVMVNSVTGATTVYYTPYLGNVIPIYDGTNMVMTTFTELSVATTDTVHSPAAIGADKVNDWYVWNDGGTLRLVHSPDWTNDTTRSAGAVLNYIYGIYTNSVAITNGPATNRGTYVGTTRSNASSQLDWIFGTRAAGGGASFLNIWNTYNRIPITTHVSDSTASWGSASAAYIPLNNSVAGGVGNRVSFVSGLQENAFLAVLGYTVTTNNQTAGLGIGLDSNVDIGIIGWLSTTGSVSNSPNAFYSNNALGFHYLQALEYGGALGMLIIGDDNDVFRSGLDFTFDM